MVAENAESFAVMLGEDQQRTFENPEARMAQRKFLAPGFTERATAGYIQEVRT
jgi:cytochrome P450